MSSLAGWKILNSKFFHRNVYHNIKIGIRCFRYWPICTKQDLLIDKNTARFNTIKTFILSTKYRSFQHQWPIEIRMMRRIVSGRILWAFQWRTFGISCIRSRLKIKFYISYIRKQNVYRILEIISSLITSSNNIQKKGTNRSRV